MKKLYSFIENKWCFSQLSHLLKKLRKTSLVLFEKVSKFISMLSQKL